MEKMMTAAGNRVTMMPPTRPPGILLRGISGLVRRSIQRAANSSSRVSELSKTSRTTKEAKAFTEKTAKKKPGTAPAGMRGGLRHCRGNIGQEPAFGAGGVHTGRIHLLLRHAAIQQHLSDAILFLESPEHHFVVLAGAPIESGH